MSMIKLEDLPEAVMLLLEGVGVGSFPRGGDERKEVVKGLRKEEEGGAVSVVIEALFTPLSVLLDAAMQLSVLFCRLGGALVWLCECDWE
jgi:hypothetical protein